MSTQAVMAPPAKESQISALSVSGLKSLLREFERTLAQKAPVQDQLVQDKALLRKFEGGHRAWEKRQVYEAEDFNILRTMRLTTRELCHSDILAWLLDHRLTGFGTHAQERLGFRLFLQALDLPRTFADSDYRVARELSGKKARLDIVIEAEGHFIIGIENKVGSQEILGFEDLWLIKNWERARQFEEAMASAREHYEQLFYKVRDKVQEKHKEISVCRPRRLSEKVPEADWKYSGGCVGFCKSKWRGNWNPWPPGIWIWNISLDELVTERADAPTASVYLGFGNYNRRRLEELRKRLRKGTQRDPRWRALNFNTDDESQSEPWFYYYLPEERKGGLSCGGVSATLSDMKVTKTVTVRELKRGTPEEALGPGEALRVKKPSGKGFLLLRETETPDLAALHKEIMRDIPLSGPSQKTDLAAWHQEDEE